MRVLLTDDEELVLEDSLYVLKDTLKDAVIVTANNYQDALELAKNPIDVAFLDIEMTEKNGIELAKELQEMQPNMNIIFLTGYDKYAIEAYKLRACDYLLKPLMAKDVEHAINSLRYKIGDSTSEDDSVKDDKLQVVCFEHFSVLVGGQPVNFRRRPAKEMFAYLVTKRGTGASLEELCDVLWPESGETKKQYCWKIVSELRLSLRDYGIEDVLITNREDYSVDTTKINCDYYDYLDKKIRWNGLFMEQYSNWAEIIKGKMIND